ncbi:hypothetical protein C2U51_23775 [Enterobacteriaceae bacterium ENNIH1]|nr:hypothetical protein C2U51_23775 [Enterobacteriaceae bacterium ENNIH1]
MDSTDTTTDPFPVAAATFWKGIKDRLPDVLSYVPVAFPFALHATKPAFSPSGKFFSRITLFFIPAATLTGCVNVLFIFLRLRFWKTHSLSIAGLMRALTYGIVWKLLTVPSLKQIY